LFDKRENLKLVTLDLRDELLVASNKLIGLGSLISKPRLQCINVIGSLFGES